MSFLSVPTADDAFWDQTTALDGKDYVLSFRYNQRERCYYLSFSTPEGVSILEGVKLVSNWPLLAAYSSVVGIPPGEMMAVATGDDACADLGELGEGKRVELIYLSADGLT